MATRKRVSKRSNTKSKAQTNRRGGAAPSAGKRTAEKEPFAYRTELSLIISAVLAILSAAAIYTESAGIVGTAFRALCGGCFGGTAYLVPLFLVGMAVLFFLSRKRKTPYKYYVLCGVLLLCAILSEKISPSPQDRFSVAELWLRGAELSGGGCFGGSLYFLISHLIGEFGTVLLMIAGLITAIMLLFELSPAAVGKVVCEFFRGAFALEEDESADSLPPSRTRKSLPRKEEPAAEEEPFDPELFRLPENVVEEQLSLTEKPKKPAKTKQEEPAEESGFSPEPSERTVSYIAPPITLLGEASADKRSESFLRELEGTAKKLIETLVSFKVSAKIVNVQSGPSVTRYEIETAEGTPLRKITGLSDDLALRLGVSGVRIAPVPGKSAIGIEIPNKTRDTVMIRTCLESPEFAASKSNLSVALGKDIAGKTIVADLAKMPHLLIAGATGSGKSVCINTLITSILYKTTPNDVKLLMIDPKQVELGVYNGIPHLISPVVTDAKKAANALNWAVSEMTRRYQIFSNTGVRNLQGYNNKADRDDTLCRMEQIVIIIDELADLMMVAPRDVEDAICRLAQLARAAGMYLVVATQRPSVDVITGIIKANIPSRIAFTTSSQVDSRTILDTVGAEKLLGRGDMLYYPTGVNKPIRVQGAFVDDPEVEEIVSFIKENSDQAKYNEEAIEFIKRDPNPKAAEGEEDEEEVWDPLLPKAIEIVIEQQQASTSLLQRKLSVGYARAARIVDQLEEQGVIGPFQGSKPREVLMTRQQYLEMTASGAQPAVPASDEFDEEDGYEEPDFSDPAEEEEEEFF